MGARVPTAFRLPGLHAHHMSPHDPHFKPTHFRISGVHRPGIPGERNEFAQSAIGLREKSGDAFETLVQNISGKVLRLLLTSVPVS